jgi:cellulose synthase/poly-beta-1,6-N-acetylglucosamine synthase-like glycosyltransferase
VIASVASAAGSALAGWEWFVLVYFLLVNTFYALLLGSAAIEMVGYRRKLWGERGERLVSSELAPRISMLAPAYNESATIAESVRALLTLSYPNLEVVLINDGSPDETLDVLVAEFDLVAIHPIFRRQVESKPVRGLYRSRVKPELVVVDKENGGKADALNAGLNVASGDLMCAVDADTLIEAEALLRMARPFLEREDVVAAGGTIRIANDSIVRGGRVVDARVPRRLLPGVQVVEYLRAFLFGRLGWNRLGGNLIISGAFGLFRRDAMIDAGGYEHDTVGEDMELVVRLRRRGIERGTAAYVAYVPDPVAWTEAPASTRVLGRQRDRWQRGLADVLWRHRHLVLNPRYGSLGMLAVPYFVAVELFGPVVEALGLVGLVVSLAFGVVNTAFAILFFLVAYGYGLVLNALTLVLEDVGARRYERWSDRLLILLWAVIESLGYRQLTVLWRLRGLWKRLRGSREWGAMTRRGFAAPPSS